MVESTTTTEAAGACTTDLAVVNAAAETTLTLEDRALEPASVLTDEGPHPANTVDYDSQLSLAISEAEIVEDPQFGLGIPVGDPDFLGDDDYYLSLSFFVPDEGTIAVGQVFTDQLEFEAGVHDGELNFVGLWHGTDRLLPGQVVATITELTDEQVCGEISTVTETDLQQFIGVEGTFAADRIQALEG
jgi:hypothetical protein